MTDVTAKLTKKLGFGCMRFPKLGEEEIDKKTLCGMFDRFLEEGFVYFDTAHGYHGGKSEEAVRECLTSRHPRESYLLADKLTDSFFSKEEEIVPLFESQLKACGVEYFDNYLIHTVTAHNYGKYSDCHAFEICSRLKEEGKIRHLGFSFHDNADFLEKVLTEHPEVEFVQLQFNYADYNDESVQSRRCYETCRRFGKPVIVMEPVRGGSLADPPESAKKVFDAFNSAHGRTDSYASYAIRFAASFENVMLVLSGMSTPEQVEDNLAHMKDFRPLDGEEKKLIEDVVAAMAGDDEIRCTACGYCLAGCPKNIPIPAIFSAINSGKRFGGWSHGYYYRISVAGKGKASDCIGCGKCEKTCPQHLEIRKHLAAAAELYDKKHEKEE